MTTTRDRIFEAAAACILEGGVRAATFDAIARRAGLGRQTLYRHFGRREAFFEALLVHRFTPVARQVKQIADDADSFENAVVAGSLETLRLARLDPIYESIVEAERSLRLDVQMLGSDTALARLFLFSWHDVFDRARIDGLLRPALSVEHAAEWLRNTHFLLGHRTDLTPAGQEALLRDFVLPGLLRASS